jgi:mannose-6-phosphate isomerase-like protein (cupin superfamily)
METLDIAQFESGDFGSTPCFIKHNIPLENIVWGDILKEVESDQIHAFGGGGYVSWLPSMPEINNIQDMMSKWKPEMKCRAHLFISTTDTGQSFLLHKDIGRDNFIIQLYGECPWRIGNFRFTAKPGDMFFIPNGVLHQARPNQPRAGIGICFEDPTLNIN